MPSGSINKDSHNYPHISNISVRSPELLSSLKNEVPKSSFFKGSEVRQHFKSEAVKNNFGDRNINPFYGGEKKRGFANVVQIKDNDVRLPHRSLDEEVHLGKENRASGETKRQKFNEVILQIMGITSSWIIL